MKKTVKIVFLVITGLIFWSALTYIAFAFLKAEINPFVWSEDSRGGMLFIIFLYVCFSPLFAMLLKDET